jgi:AICAR transformylase/IMP cyclohydrolase PurH
MEGRLFRKRVQARRDEDLALEMRLVRFPFRQGGVLRHGEMEIGVGDGGVARVGGGDLAARTADKSAPARAIFEAK